MKSIKNTNWQPATIEDVKIGARMKWWEMGEGTVAFNPEFRHDATLEDVEKKRRPRGSIHPFFVQTDANGDGFWPIAAIEKGYRVYVEKS